METKEVLMIEWVVASRQCPEGDWQPHMGWKFHNMQELWELWWVSPWPNPLGDFYISFRDRPDYLGAGYPLPGTWIAPPFQGIIVSSQEHIRVEVEKGEHITTLRVWSKPS